MRRPNVYAAGGFDRAAHRRRDDAWLSEVRGHGRLRLVPVWRSRSLILAGEQPAALFADPQALAAEALLTFLGEAEEEVFFAVDLSELEEEAAQALARSLAEGAEFLDLRRVGGLLPRRDAALLAYARGLSWWHQRHRFCGVCGAPTVPESAGHVRRCTNPDCAVEHFPRTDPATIMLVTDGGRCLLGHNKRFPIQKMYSTLAGFVEPGESLEDAVAREVREEVGVEVVNVRYHSSQPWPFPASLMIGFFADAATSEIRIDEDELADARWFTRDELRRIGELGLALPRVDSIARQLVETWLAGEA